MYFPFRGKNKCKNKSAVCCGAKLVDFDPTRRIKWGEEKSFIKNSMTHENGKSEHLSILKELAEFCMSRPLLFCTYFGKGKNLLKPKIFWTKSPALLSNINTKILNYFPEENQCIFWADLVVRNDMTLSMFQVKCWSFWVSASVRRLAWSACSASQWTWRPGSPPPDQRPLQRIPQEGCLHSQIRKNAPIVSEQTQENFCCKCREKEVV